MATENDLSRVENTGNLRSINRHVWDQEQLESHLANGDSRHSRVLTRLRAYPGEEEAEGLPSERNYVDASSWSRSVWVLEAKPGPWTKYFAVFNVTNESRTLDVGNLNLTIDQTWTDLVEGTSCVTDRSGPLELEPYRFLWIGNGV